MARIPEKDLFTKSTMSFGDHLEELRICLFRSVLGIVIGFLLGLLVASQVVEFIKVPLTKALTQYFLELEKEEITIQYGEDAAERLVLVDQGLVMESMLIDLEELSINLRRNYNVQGPLIGFQPYSFMYDDFLQDGVKNLFSQLVESEETAAGYLHALLDDDDRAVVKKLSTLTNEQLGQDDTLRVESIRLLNSWVADDQLASATVFATVGKENLSIQSLRTRVKKNSGEATGRSSVRRLNRLLISEAFNDCLRPVQPQLLSVPLWKPISVRVQTLNAHEAFMIWLKAAFISGFVLASPWVFLQIWTFVAAGLYPHERKYVKIYLPLSLLLFFGGASLAFFYVFEPVLDFLFSFNRAMNIHPDPRISEWLGFVLFLPLGFGIAFQLPLVMLLLHRVGIISVQTFLSKWRIAVLVICVISMLLTPADPISMLLMAVPLVVLYFFGIGLALWMPRIQNPYSDGYDPS
jgi:sec-independent protein translocase protein TatC